MNKLSNSKAKKTLQHPFVQGELFPDLAGAEGAKPQNAKQKDASFDFWEPEVFPIHEANEQAVSSPIESRWYNNIQVNSYRTQDGMNILSVMGSDGVMMSVPGSFDTPVEMTKTVVEEKIPPQPSAQVFVEKVPPVMNNTSLASKAEAFKSQIKEASVPQPVKPKAPYNPADVPPLTYGTPRKEGVNLLRIFRPGCK
jgi:hypothetical protein